MKARLRNIIIFCLAIAVQGCNEDSDAVSNVSEPDSNNESDANNTTDPGSTNAALILNGERLNNLTADNSSQLNYVVLIPENARNLVIETKGGEGDLNLALSFDMETECESRVDGVRQICQITMPGEGEHLITLTADDEFIGAELSVSYQQATTNDPGAGNCEITQLEQDLVDAHNRARSTARECGGQYYDAAGPLTWSCELNRAAYLHSKDMADNDYFDHTNLAGESPSKRATDQGYNYSYVGENIAAGQRDMESAMQGWLSSPGHCANIMNPNYAELGASLAENSNSRYRLYWTAMFGRPR